MIVVTTPTGHIGSKVVRLLLEANEAVRVVVRDPAKLSPEVLAKVEVVQGSTDDEAVLYSAFEGAESVYWVVPPDWKVPRPTRRNGSAMARTPSSPKGSR